MKTNKVQTKRWKRMTLALLVVAMAHTGAFIGSGRAAVSVGAVKSATAHHWTARPPYIRSNVLVQSQTKTQVLRPVATSPCAEWRFLQSKCRLAKVHRRQPRPAQACNNPYLVSKCRTSR